MLAALSRRRSRVPGPVRTATNRRSTPARRRPGRCDIADRRVATAVPSPSCPQVVAQPRSARPLRRTGAYRAGQGQRGPDRYANVSLRHQLPAARSRVAHDGCSSRGVRPGRQQRPALPQQAAGQGLTPGPFCGGRAESIRALVPVAGIPGVVAVFVEQRVLGAVTTRGSRRHHRVWSWDNLGTGRIAAGLASGDYPLAAHST